MREIVFDTETTGLDPIQGDRLVEIGCIELINRFPTGQTFHCYFNPERDMPEPAFKVHGLSVEFLKDKPLFAHKVEELIEFLGDAPLVAHNAMFDLGFLNAELERVKKAAVARERLVDTLMLARRKHPGGSNRLDDLCARYGIDNSTPHQARRAARRRAAGRGLCRADRRAPGATSALPTSAIGAGEARRDGDRRARAPAAAAAAGRRRRSATRTAPSSRRWAKPRSGGNYLSTPGGLSQPSAAAAGCLLRHALPIERDEIDRIEHQRREAAVAHRGRDDLAGERKQQPRAFDQHQRLKLLLRHVLDAEHAGVYQLEVEHHAAGGLGLAFEPERRPRSRCRSAGWR